jgi:hypothetical protein
LFLSLPKLKDAKYLQILFLKLWLYDKYQLLTLTFYQFTDFLIQLLPFISHRDVTNHLFHSSSVNIVSGKINSDVIFTGLKDKQTLSDRVENKHRSDFLSFSVVSTTLLLCVCMCVCVCVCVCVRVPTLGSWEAGIIKNEIILNSLWEFTVENIKIFMEISIFSCLSYVSSGNLLFFMF